MMYTKRPIDKLAKEEIENGEAHIKSYELKLIDGKTIYHGFLVLTTFKLVYKPLQKPKDPFLPELKRRYFTVPHNVVLRIDEVVDRKNPQIYFLELHTKDFRFLRFISENLALLQQLNDNIQKLAFPPKLNTLFCYQFRYESPCNGWDVYNAHQEFERMGVVIGGEGDTPFTYVDNWKEGTGQPPMCLSYPQFIVVPRAMGKDEVLASANFRTKNRLPALSYYHKLTKTSIWRSSQNMSGYTQNRSVEDEKLLFMIGRSNPRTERLQIYDARSYVIAQLNKLKQGGYENTDKYVNCNIEFCAIDNIHTVRDAYNKLTAICCTNAENNKEFFA